MNSKLVTIGALCVFLAACGGDGGSGSPDSPKTSLAEGFWVGEASTGVIVNLAVLENGESWGLYGDTDSLYGALYGNTKTSDSTHLSGSGKDFNLVDRDVESATYSGTFEAKTSMNITLSNGITFAATYSDKYDQPASLATLAGSFSGWGVTGRTYPAGISISIAADGKITAPEAEGCGGVGSATPRASGKNVFDILVTFQGAACALGNGTTVRGVAFYDTDTETVQALALNGAKDDGFIFIGSKSQQLQ